MIFNILKGEIVMCKELEAIYKLGADSGKTKASRS